MLWHLRCQNPLYCFLADVAINVFDLNLACLTNDKMVLTAQILLHQRNCCLMACCPGTASLKKAGTGALHAIADVEALSQRLLLVTTWCSTAC